MIALDIEVLPNYFLFGIKRLSSGNTLQVEVFGRKNRLSKNDKNKINSALTKFTSFGFNSINYDMPLINYALDGATCEQIYLASKDIIEKGQPSWLTYKALDINPRSYDHFDICEPSPAVMLSLKGYGARVGSKHLQDFHLDAHAEIMPIQANALKLYNINDLDTTIDLYNAIKDRIDLRIKMSEQYGIDLRSKSDAQIAEAVITSELEKLKVTVTKPSQNIKSVWYAAPDYIKFKSKQLQEFLEIISSTTFRVLENGQLELPKTLEDAKIVIGTTTYNLGIGGLHSQEKSLSICSNETHVMRNADFASYYPFIILNNNLYPKHLGIKFLTVYRKIVEERLKAKAEGNKLVADSLKITINGSFGKFGSKFSKLYSPDLLLATTITGQLTLLMLIETLEANGIRVVSANTDGLEYFCPRDKVQLAEAIIFDLELITGFEMEHGEYKALHAKDVNNYVAVYNGCTKAKGLYADTTLSKGRSTPIVYTAIREYLLNGIEPLNTILSCDDVNQFISARSVKGGGVYDGNFLGKTVRWYYSKKSKGCISYATNGNKVPKTDGAVPMMTLVDVIPKDIDYDWYYQEAVSKLKDLGVEL